jgi:hypothetical protein
MKNFLIAFTLVLSSFASNTLFGQTLAVQNFSKDLPQSLADNKNSESNLAWYSDDSERKFFLDLEKLSVNLNDIVVKNEKNEVLFQDKLWNLPVNSIYELDLTTYDKGTYDVEIRTFTTSMHKKVVLK